MLVGSLGGSPKLGKKPEIAKYSRISLLVARLPAACTLSILASHLPLSRLLSLHLLLGRAVPPATHQLAGPKGHTKAADLFRFIFPSLRYLLFLELQKDDDRKESLFSMRFWKVIRQNYEKCKE